jgi:hypothetical protein
VTAVVALAAANVGADNYAVTDAQRDPLKIGVIAVSSDGRNGANILVALDDREFQLAAAVLRGIALKGVLVRSANTGQFHFDQDATCSRFRQWIFLYFILTWFNKCRREYALGRHRSVLFVASALRLAITCLTS